VRGDKLRPFRYRVEEVHHFLLLLRDCKEFIREFSYESHVAGGDGVVGGLEGVEVVFSVGVEDSFHEVGLIEHTVNKVFTI
jgi:hypothetical protein